MFNTLWKVKCRDGTTRCKPCSEHLCWVLCYELNSYTGSPTHPHCTYKCLSTSRVSYPHDTYTKITAVDLNLSGRFWKVNFFYWFSGWKECEKFLLLSSKLCQYFELYRLLETFDWFWVWWKIGSEQWDFFKISFLKYFTRLFMLSAHTNMLITLIASLLFKWAN